MSDFKLAVGIFIVGSIAAYNIIDPYNPKHGEKARAEAEKYERQREAEKRWEASREAAYRARDEADDAIRAEAIERRTRLEKASSTVRVSNSNGVRVDQYVLKRGGVITCTTTISGNAPAIFNCDGDV